MNTTIAPSVRALTICIAATLGFNAANASTDGASTNQSKTNSILTYVVRFSDLDVSKSEGAKKLYGRLSHAAEVVCKPLETARSYASDQYEVCMKKAIADAVASVNRPLLSRYHQSRTRNGKVRIVELAKVD